MYFFYFVLFLRCNKFEFVYLVRCYLYFFETCCIFFKSFSVTGKKAVCLFITIITKFFKSLSIFRRHDHSLSSKEKFF